MGEVAWVKQMVETRAIRQIETEYMINKSRSIYIALEGSGLNPFWKESDVLRFDEMWAKRVNIWDIARFFERDPDEVALLAIDRARKGFIKPRRGGVMGKGSIKK